MSQQPMKPSQHKQTLVRVSEQALSARPILADEPRLENPVVKSARVTDIHTPKCVGHSLPEHIADGCRSRLELVVQVYRSSSLISRGGCNEMPEMPAVTAVSTTTFPLSALETCYPVSSSRLGLRFATDLNTKPRAVEGCRLISQLLTAELMVQELARSVWPCIC